MAPWARTIDERAAAAWARIKRRRGMRAAVARSVGVRFQTVAKWKEVPLHLVFDVAAISGARAETLRPEFFERDPVRHPPAIVASAAQVHAPGIKTDALLAALTVPSRR